MEIICSKDQCCGCQACKDICPVKAINMIHSQNGFKFPHISQTLCIDCELCRKVCPGINIAPQFTVKSKLYSAYSKNEIIRHDSTSGGIFFEVAHFWLNKYYPNGIVYGAAFDKNLFLRHIGVTNTDNLYPLLKSKYVECDTNSVFLKIKKELKVGKFVLFCGTPCQCAALRNYLNNKDISNLLIIDFLCHGVPSQDLFLKSIQQLERKYKGKIESFIFREKPMKRYTGIDHYFSFKIRKKNKSIWKIGLPNWKFPYYSGFGKHYSLRPSCYDCIYATPNRTGDITLGDFWKLDTIDEIHDFEKGYSLLLVNSLKGNTILNDLADKIEFREYPIEVVKLLNPTYSHGAIKTPENQQALLDLETLPYRDYMKKYLLNRKDPFSRLIRFTKRLYSSIYERTEH